MKRFLALLLSSVLALSMSACGNSSSSEKAPEASGESSGEEARYLTLSAVAASSGLFPYLVSIGEVLSNLPELDITVAESGGNVSNTNEMRAQEISIANSMSNTDFESYTGTGTTYSEPYEDVRIMWYYQSTPIQIAVAADTGISSIEELDGQNFNPGGTGTAAAIVIHQAFDILGIEPNYFEAAQADAADAYANRQIVGVVKTGAYPDSYLVQADTNREMELLSFPDETMDMLLKEMPSVSSDVVPAGSYEGVDYDINTFTAYQGIQVDMSFSQELGYKMCKAMWEEYDSTWKTAFPVGAESDIWGMTLKSAIPLHAGTVQYLVELGYTVPENIIPAEYVPVG